VPALADNTGLTAGLSKALASDRLLVHDRDRVLADLAARRWCRGDQRLPGDRSISRPVWASRFGAGRVALSE
jgi:hypothetical protein